MAATFARSGSARERPSFNSRLAAASARPETIYKRYRVCWDQMLPREILGKLVLCANTGGLYGKATKNSLCGTENWVWWDLKESPEQVE